jgi:hypothetical protein
MAIAGKKRPERPDQKIFVMEKILIFIKHNFSFLWRLIEWFNGLLFSIFYGSRMVSMLPGVFNNSVMPPYTCRRLLPQDAEPLHELINSQKESDLKYFNPHKFDLASIKKQFTNRSFLLMGVFDGKKLAGYFFLRFFINKRCFVGRLIDISYRGKGIGPLMNTIMYEIAWHMGFRCLSTISRNNTAVMRAHAKNQRMIVLKELQNDYLLVEFIRDINL